MELEKTDIYAFAIVCWEIHSEHHPYLSELVNQSIEQLVDDIRLKAFRPPVEPLTSKNDPQRILIELFESCWKQDPLERLNWDSIFTMVFRFEEEVSQNQTIASVKTLSGPSGKNNDAQKPQKKVSLQDADEKTYVVPLPILYENEEDVFNEEPEPQAVPQRTSDVKRQKVHAHHRTNDADTPAKNDYPMQDSDITLAWNQASLFSSFKSRPRNPFSFPTSNTSNTLRSTDSDRTLQNLDMRDKHVTARDLFNQNNTFLNRAKQDNAAQSENTVTAEMFKSRVIVVDTHTDESNPS